MKVKALALLLALVIVLTACTQSQEAAVPVEMDLPMQLETEHFVFYSLDKDKSCMQDLADEIESNYGRLTDSMKMSIDYKPGIYIYPSLKDFHKAIGQPKANAWVVGTAWGRDIRMVSPLNPGPKCDYEAIKKVLVHEFAHVLHMDMAGIPSSFHYWLWEGLATYHAEQLGEKEKKLLAKEVSQNKAPSMEKLRNEFYKVNNGYYFAGSLVEFIVSEYGNDKLVELLKEPDEMEKCIGITSSQLEEMWIEYIKEQYN